MPRLSCLFCVFQPEAVMALSAQHNPEKFAEWVKTEVQVKHPIRQNLSLQELQRKLQAGTEIKKSSRSPKDGDPRQDHARLDRFSLEQVLQQLARHVGQVLARGRNKPVIRLGWRDDGGVCVHVDDGEVSRHVAWARQHAPGASMAALAVADVLGLPLIEDGSGPEAT